MGDGAAGTDRQFTQEGVGTHYAWAARLAGFPFAGFPFEGFDVFTEFVPNQRITDTSFSSLEGTWTYLFEPEGSGTKLTVVNRVRSFWRIQPFETLLDWLTAKTHDPRLRG